MRQLARRADVLVESSGPARWMPGAGLRGAIALNPRLIYASASPYGQKGPKASWPATDLTIEAAAGGRPAGRPTDRRCPWATRRRRSTSARRRRPTSSSPSTSASSPVGPAPRRVDVRGDDLTLMNGPGYPATSAATRPAPATTGRRRAGATRGAVLGGVRRRLRRRHVDEQRQFYAALMTACCRRCARQAAERYARGIDWDAWEVARQSRHADRRAGRARGRGGARLLRLQTKQELMQWAWESDVHLGPVNTTRRPAEEPALPGAGYWQKVGDYMHPGLSVRSSHARW